VCGADAIPFVNDLFETVAYKSYLPGAPPPPSKRAPPAPNFALPPLATALGELSYNDVPIASAPQIAGLQRGGRKRGWNDRGEADGPQGQVEDRGKQGRRGIKQPRRGRGGRHDDVAGAGYNTTGFSDATGQMPYFPRVLSGHFDAMGALMGMGQLAFTGNTFAAPPPPGRRRQRCRDYDTKGYCARGNTCMFQHGDEPVYPPPSGPFGAQKVPHPQHVEGMLNIELGLIKCKLTGSRVRSRKCANGSIDVWRAEFASASTLPAG
jgi:RNA-binding protein 26